MLLDKLNQLILHLKRINQCHHLLHIQALKIQEKGVVLQMGILQLLLEDMVLFLQPQEDMAHFHQQLDMVHCHHHQGAMVNFHLIQVAIQEWILQMEDIQVFKEVVVRRHNIIKQVVIQTVLPLHLNQLVSIIHLHPNHTALFTQQYHHLMNQHTKTNRLQTIKTLQQLDISHKQMLAET